MPSCRSSNRVASPSDWRVGARPGRRERGRRDARTGAPAPSGGGAGHAMGSFVAAPGLALAAERGSRPEERLGALRVVSTRQTRSSGCGTTVAGSTWTLALDAESASTSVDSGVGCHLMTSICPVCVGVAGEMSRLTANRPRAVCTIPLTHPIAALAHPIALAHPTGPLDHPTGPLAHPTGPLAHPTGPLAHPIASPRRDNPMKTDPMNADSISPAGVLLRVPGAVAGGGFQPRALARMVVFVAQVPTTSSSICSLRCHGGSPCV